MKKRGVTTFARGVIYLIAAAALAVCFILLPELVREEGVGKPFNPYVVFSFFATVYTVAIPFFIALYQAHKLLNYIDKNKAFSPQSVRALKNIKICAIVSSVLIFVAVISWVNFAKIMNPEEDMPPFLMFGFILTFTSSIIAVFAALLQKLVADGIVLKSENDLIV